MKVTEVLNKMQDLVNRGLGNVDLGIILHNTVHDIDQILVGTPGGDVEDGVNVTKLDAIVAYMTRIVRPIYFLDHTKKWKKVDE